MAIQATHILFARDLKDELEIKDLDAYYSGCLYPDSRFTTGVDRPETHNNAKAQHPFVPGLSSFELGWGTHLLYDKLGGERYIPFLGELGLPGPNFPPGWIRVTAFKAVEDMKSYERLGEDRQLLQSLNATENPNGEKLEDVQKWHDWIHKLYTSKPTPETYRERFKDIRLPDDVADKFYNDILFVLSNDKLRNEIESMYDSILEYTIKEFRKTL